MPSRPLHPLPRALATLLGVGRVPVMPGTCGTLVAALPCLLLPGAAYPWALAGGVLAATTLSVLIARRLPPEQQDPSWFVLDEAAGFWLAALHPSRPGLLHLALAVVLFRLFDILKPPPLRRLERTGGGLGIVLDDLGAGAYALAVLAALSALGATFTP